MEEQYISRIILELQPRSRRGYRCLFGIRENKSLNQYSFDSNQFTQLFLQQYHSQSLRKGQHIKCNHLIVAVKQIQRDWSTVLGNTQVEYCIRGLPLKNEEKCFIDEKKEGQLNQSFLSDMKTRLSNLEEVYSCYCSECKKCLSYGDLFIKTENWSRPILCLSCYELSFTEKCLRCTKPITFHQETLTKDGLTYIRFVEYNGFYWHSDCCVCVRCLESLIGKKYYQDEIYHQLYCFEHIPNEIE